jgi:hypothetical protein
MIHLKVAPEVSTLDFGNGLVLSGFRVPSLATRRTETEVELRDGQTFAIAGLLDNSVDETLRKVPGIGDIPVLGYLFKSQAYTKRATELVVMITPHILRRDSPGVTPNLPGLVEPFLQAPGKRQAPPPPAFTTPMTQVSPASAPLNASGASAGQAPAAAPSAVVSTPAASTFAPVAPATAAVTTPAPAAQAAASPAPVTKADKKQQEAFAKEAARLQETQRKEASKQAVADARRAKKEQEEAARQQKVDAAREQAEAKLAEKRANEQAAIDRKRMAEQQVAAARVKEIADKLAKEQEKQRLVDEQADKEKAARDAELARLVEQYKKLTAPTTATKAQ